MIIDVHNHYYPPGYMDAVRRGPSAVRITTDAEGNPLLHYPGDYNVAVRGHRDIEFRQHELDRVGIDRQVVTLTTPGVHVEQPRRAIELARLVNDEFAATKRERGSHFTALATLPLNDPAASVIELRRAVTELGLPGAMLFSNVNGVPLADPRFEPLYTEADRLGCILHIHPTNPVNVDAMQEYWLMPLVGFLFDTTLAAAHLAFAGVMERHQKIRWVLSHLGGAIPYLAERLDRGWEAFPDCRRNIDRRPSEYLKRCYYDTVNFNQDALMLAVAFAGADHVLAGSDYPHQIGSMETMLGALKGLPVSPTQRGQILGENAQALYGF